MRAYYTGEEKCTNPWYPQRRRPAVVLEVQTHNIPISCDHHHPPLRVHRGKWVAMAWTTPGIQEDTGSLHAFTQESESLTYAVRHTLPTLRISCSTEGTGCALRPRNPLTRR
ncbi:hypothetical protein, unlikely [Trypanosoma congolense IL3000]|uniref:Uncharacterized protein n=1 Tax=Trypanosoma congolense (strain IL3000) TaxID=1068625 RepID=F9WFC7_TRYCI|nr:hypothetical protein, unlikely [Trypanosoma congolense IL3000]